MGNIWSFLIMSAIPEIERDDLYLYPSSCLIQYRQEGGGRPGMHTVTE